MATYADQKPTVVIADDNIECIQAAVELLQEGFEIVKSVNDGTEALEAVRELNPDLILLDIAMPCKDGFEIARWIREGALPTRIILMTVTEDQEYALAAAELGASYVVKRRLHSDLVRAAKEALAGNLFLSPV